MESYNVRKGPDKIYFEMKGKLINQRMIVSGRKMKMIDLKTNAERIMNTNPEILKKCSRLFLIQWKMEIGKILYWYLGMFIV